MSTIITALIVIGSIAAITLVLIYINNKHQEREREKLLHRFSQIARENKMSFTSHEVLQDGIIGLDGLSKKLLILQSSEDDLKWSIINLEEVKACNVKKLYQATNRGTLKKRVIEEHLEKVVLQFELKEEKEKIEIPFFIFSKNHLYQLAELEQKQSIGKPAFLNYYSPSLKKRLNKPIQYDTESKNSFNQ
jgi:hypothetical protein